MNIKDMKGLKYPDEYFIKFFFKNKLHEKKGLKYLEFGCGNGSNLMLPYQYGEGNEVIGIDYDSSLIENANYNFKLIKKSDASYQFYSDDMRSFAKDNKKIYADVLALPSVIYYIGKNDFLIFLTTLVSNYNIKNNIPFYIRVRTTNDFRFGLGKKIDSKTYQLPNDVITGEENAQIRFYSESEIVDILKKYLNLQDYSIFHLNNQNEHNGEIVLNSDIVIWGTIN